MPETGPLDVPHSHDHLARKNIRHAPTTNYESKTTLRTENRMGKRGYQPTGDLYMSRSTPRCRVAGPQYHQEVNTGRILWETVYRNANNCKQGPEELEGIPSPKNPWLEVYNVEHRY